MPPLPRTWPRRPASVSSAAWSLLPSTRITFCAVLALARSTRTPATSITSAPRAPRQPHSHHWSLPGQACRGEWLTRFAADRGRTVGRRRAWAVDEAGSARRIPGAAVEPECPRLYRADLEQAGRRPGILGQARCDLVFIRSLDDVQGLLAAADRAAEDDKAVLDEPVHECRVLIPPVLVADLTRGIPAWAVDQPHREIGHVRSVLAAADSRSGARSASTS